MPKYKVYFSGALYAYEIIEAENAEAASDEACRPEHVLNLTQEENDPDWQLADCDIEEVKE